MNRKFPNIIEKIKLCYLGSMPWDFLKVRIFFSIFRSVNTSRENTIELHTNYGVYFANPADYVSCELAAAGVWEISVTTLVERYLKQGDTFVDVGANFGYYTVIAAKLVGDSGRVESFECSETCLDLLHQNVSINNIENIVQIRPFAVSDKVGPVSWFANMDTGLGSLKPVRRSDATGLVESKRLDDFYFEKGVDLIKIDIEGAELMALKGMKNTLMTYRPNVICEVTKGKEHQQLMDFMTDIGYQAHLIPRQTRRFPPFEPIPETLLPLNEFPDEMAQIDVLFSPKAGMHRND